MEKKEKFILILILVLSGFSNEAAEAQSSFQKILEDYQEKDFVSMNVKKTLTQNLIKKKTQTKGRLFLSKNLWRLNIESPQKSHIIFDGKTILLCNPETQIKQKLKKRKTPLLSMLFNAQVFKENFKYEKTSIKGRTQVASFAGLGSQTQARRLFIQIEKNRILSVRIVWPPPIGEEHYRFSQIEFNKKRPDKIFQHSSCLRGLSHIP